MTTFFRVQKLDRVGAVGAQVAVDRVLQPVADSTTTPTRMTQARAAVESTI